MENVAYLEIDDINSDGSLKPYVGNGKPVLVMGQGSFCGYCKMAKPDYQNLANKMNKVVVATILMDGDPSEKEASKFFKVWDSNYRGVPSYFGFDRNGKFVKVHMGGRDVGSLETFCNEL